MGIFDSQPNTSSVRNLVVKYARRLPPVRIAKRAYQPFDVLIKDSIENRWKVNSFSGSGLIAHEIKSRVEESITVLCTHYYITDSDYL
jgi:hypothetical protein